MEVGGAAVLAGMVSALRSSTPRTLVLVAGDEFTGTPVSTLTNGLSQVQILNRTGIDGFVPGNHEFDYGWQSLLDVMRKARFPVLLANVVRVETMERLFPPDTVLHLAGVEVGIIGLIYQEFTRSVIRDRALGVTGLDPVLSARTFVASRRDSCDLLVALTHIGWRGDSLLAAEVEGLDVIVGGHSNTVIDPPREVNGVIIVQSGPYGRNLGRLVLEVDTAEGGITRCRGELLRVEADAAQPDPNVDKLVRRLEKRYTHRLDRQIGTLQTDWHIHSRSPSNLAQWAVDVLHSEVPEAHLAVINNGNIRKSLPRGPILERDIWEICPFENQILVLQISGMELRQVVRKQLEEPREFLTWSGLRLESEDGEIRTLTVRGRPVDDMDEYSVVATGYIWDHLDSYFGLQQGERPIFYLPESNQRESLVEAVIAQSVISAPTDDRWVAK